MISSPWKNIVLYENNACSVVIHRITTLYDSGQILNGYVGIRTPFPSISYWFITLALLIDDDVLLTTIANASCNPSLRKNGGLYDDIPEVTQARLIMHEWKQKIQSGYLTADNAVARELTAFFRKIWRIQP
jgi:hypothetical protein